ncbi:tRNA (adenosine(37)-N6)-dimethylallyltransferase MiaA [Naumannella huperziae]
MSTPPLLVLNGPTASGKSGLAIALAERLSAAGRPAEIVNADSMLVYRGMDIGTAKPTRDEQARVPHHLIDILDPHEPAAVADFQRLARDRIGALRDRGVLPILAGGSALYVRAIVDEFDFPGTDPAVRARWETELARVGAPALHRELALRAPGAAARILPGNGRRIVRALELHELGAAVSGRLPPPRYALPAVAQLGLEIDRDALDRRIADRVERMWADGFVEEVRRLAADGLADTPTASRALGYSQLLRHLAGELTEDEARGATIAATRRFARKQLGWFRRDPRIRWYPALDPDLASRILADAQHWDHA